MLLIVGLAFIDKYSYSATLVVSGRRDLPERQCYEALGYDGANSHAYPLIDERLFIFLKIRNSKH